MRDITADAKAIFLEALDRNGEDERMRFLDQACRADANLRARVEELMRAHRDAGAFLGGDEVIDATHDQPDVAGSGTVIGPYKLLEQIGEGGMGAVYLAQQTEPVKRLVAVKLIKAGMDSKQVIARFEAEQQALALMDHPNIARVLDAGTTDAGRPFFVMDLVKGVPITKYCDEHRLTTRQRLELFIPVCQAIQHAHQKGIIHRDLKPSKVLVAHYDGKPVPKVIDFGVAKAVGQSLTGRTLVTGFGAILGTPEYMSPEQAEINQLDIDTRSDIYSLGVLLYELLAGSPPFSRKDLEKAGMLEMLRVIREKQPSKPSTKLSTAEGLPTLAANRGTEPAKLTKLLRGELDWIVMKSLEKDRNRRYETANGFAMDVQRYLADEVVQACPPTLGYRLQKFMRRNRRTVVAASVVILALVGGVIGATWGMFRARTAEADAAREADKKSEALTDAKTNLEDARAAVDQLLTRLADERLAEVPQMELIRRELLQDALRFYQKFLARKGDEPLIRREAARAYRRMGHIYNQLGQDSEADEAYRKAIAMMEELGAASSSDPNQRSELVCTRLDYSWVVSQGLLKGDECVRQLRRAVEVAESFLADFPDLPESRKTWFNARNTLAGALTNHRQPEEAENILRESLRLADSDVSLYSTHVTLAFLFWSKQRLPEAVKQFRHALEIAEKCVAKTPSSIWIKQEVGHALQHLARVLTANQEPVEAADYQRRAVLIFGKLADDFPAGPIFRHELATAQVEHAAVLKQLGQTAEAEKACRRAVDLYEKLANDFPPIPTFRQSAFDQRIDLSRSLAQGRRPLEAQEVLGKATTVSEKLRDNFAGRLVYKRVLVRSHLELARLLRAGGKTLEAQTTFDRAVAIQQALEKDFADKPEFRRELASAHLSAADLLREDGRAEEAERFYHLAEAHWRQLIAGAPDDVEGLRGLASNYHNLGLLLPRERGAEEAFAHAVETWAKLLALSPADVGARGEKGHGHRLVGFLLTLEEHRILCPWRKGHGHRLAGFLAQSNPARLAEAENHFREALRLFEALHSEFPDNAGHWHFVADTHRQLGQILNAAHKPQEAEKSFRRSVELHEQRAAKLPAHPEFNLEMYLAYSDLGDQLVANGPAQAAEEWFQQAAASFSKHIEYDSKNWWAWKCRGEAYAQLKEWDKAGADLVKAVELAPQQPVLHYRHALARLALADARHYRISCADMVSRSGAFSDQSAASLTVWTCALAPDAVADWQPLVQLAEKVVAANPKDSDKLQDLGAILYRAGRYQEAAKRLEEAVAAEAAFPEAQSPYAVRVYTGLFQAMTLHRLGCTDKAQQLLRKAVNDIDQPSETTKIAIGAWDRRLTLRLLRQEAEDLLKKGSKAKDREPEKKQN